MHALVVQAQCSSTHFLLSPKLYTYVALYNILTTCVQPVKQHLAKLYMHNVLPMRTSGIVIELVSSNVLAHLAV
jgi:hypothetical protein